MKQSPTAKAKKPAPKVRKPAPKKAKAPAKPVAQPDEEERPALTPKMEQFARAVVSGMTYSDAYRAAYNAQSMAKSTVQKRASELAGRGDVSGRIGELRREATEHLVWSRGMSLQVLMEVALDVEKTAKQSERVAAIKELNAMHGFNAPQKLDVGLRDLEPLTDESWL